MGATYGYIPYNGQFINDATDNTDQASLGKCALVFDDEVSDDSATTGISEITPSVSKTSSAFYTLEGQKVQRLNRGIYIHEGKKIIVK